MKRYKFEKILLLISLYIICFFLFFLSVFRWEKGGDWFGYYHFFNNLNVRTHEIGRYYEYGYELLNFIIKQWTDNYSVLLFSLAIIVVVFQYRIIFKYSFNPFLTFLFFFSIGGFANIFPLRQTIAGAIIFSTVPFLIRRKVIFFLFFVFLATLFHQTAVFFLPFYWLSEIKMKKTFYLILFLLFLAISVFLKSYILILLSQVGGAWAGRITFYLASDLNTAYSEKIILIGSIINKLFVLFLLLFFVNDNTEFYKKIFNLYYFSICIFLLLAPISLAFARIAQYGESFQIFLLPYIFKKTSKENSCVFLFLIYIYLLLKIYSSLTQFPSLYYPYRSILF